jgi:Derlin-2/3
MLEESSFANRKADYFWLLFLSSLMLLVRTSSLPPLPPLYQTVYAFRPPLQGLSPLFNLPFLSSPLAYVPIYFWSRRHPTTPISLFGLLTITAPYLPFALVAFSWVLTGTWRAAASDLVGCAVGHVGWFIRDVWTREMVGGPTILSEAPDVL